MREIKFRAWNKDEIDWEPVPFIITEGLNPTKIIGFLDENEGQCLLEDGHAIVQYTGLKDKNGREIYEGDIYSYELYKVFVSGGNVEESTGKGFDVVEYKDGAFYHGDELLADVIEYDALLEYEGNIYENPELLEVSK